jgi:drug/metabolite transporter (DMT)-like permease
LTAQALPYILLVGVIFGSTIVTARFSVGQFHPITYLALRAMLASLSYGAVYAVNPRRRPWPRDRSLWRHATVFGLFGTAVPMVCYIYALQYLSSGMASTLLTTGPAVAILLAHFFLDDEPLTARKGFGAALALSGAVLMAVRGESGLADVGRANPLGYGLVVIALIVANGMTIYARKFMRELDAFDVSSIRMMVTMVVVAPFAVLFTGIDVDAIDIPGILALVYGALAGNFGGMYLAYRNVMRFGVTITAMTDYVTPIVASLGGVLVLGEQITIGMAFGMGLIIAGIAFINWRRRVPKVEAILEDTACT